MGLAGGTEGVLIGGQLGLAHQAAVFFPELLNRSTTIVHGVIVAILFYCLKHSYLPT
jgi:hypothetical protein